MIIRKIGALFLAILLISGIFSCKIFAPRNNAGNKSASAEKIIFPSPPDTARIQFLTHISSSDNISGKQSKFNKFIFGEEEPKLIIKPSGVFMRFGKIYVCDIGYKGLEIIDLEKKQFSYFKPGGVGVLKLPLGCYVDEQGKLYVADGKRRQIVIFDKDGKYLDSFGETGDYKPTGVFVSDNKIWVANVKNHAVHVYDRKDNKLLFKFPNAEFGEKGYLNQPTTLWVTNDKVYVSDFGDFKIKIYDKKGNYLESVGSYGKLPGQFTRPKGVAVDRDDNLFVVDAAFENVQIFDKKNRLLMHFGGSYKGPGFMSLPIGIAINYEDSKYFEKYVDSDYELKYIILVTNQYSPEKLNVYGRIEMKK